jgi:hypothetical protein
MPHSPPRLLVTSRLAGSAGAAKNCAATSRRLERSAGRRRDSLALRVFVKLERGI